MRKTIEKKNNWSVIYNEEKYKNNTFCCTETEIYINKMLIKKLDTFCFTFALECCNNFLNKYIFRYRIYKKKIITYLYSNCKLT